jgi:hypothetical protein
MKTNLREVDGINIGIHLALDGVQQWALVNMVINIRVAYNANIS